MSCIIFPGVPTSVAISGFTSPINEGASMTLTCDVTGGNPTPTIDWYLDGVLVLSNMASYTYTAARADDMDGIYCSATNSAGFLLSATSTLDIHCECLSRVFMTP